MSRDNVLPFKATIPFKLSPELDMNISTDLIAYDKAKTKAISFHNMKEVNDALLQLILQVDLWLDDIETHQSALKEEYSTPTSRNYWMFMDAICDLGVVLQFIYVMDKNNISFGKDAEYKKQLEKAFKQFIGFVEIKNTKMFFEFLMYQIEEFKTWRDMSNGWILKVAPNSKQESFDNAYNLLIGIYRFFQNNITHEVDCSNWSRERFYSSL